MHVDCNLFCCCCYRLFLSLLSEILMTFASVLVRGRGMQVHEKMCGLLGFTLHYFKLIIGNVLVNLGANEKEIVKQTNIYIYIYVMVWSGRTGHRQRSQ